jgi:hypothetical protein
MRTAWRGRATSLRHSMPPSHSDAGNVPDARSIADSIGMAER